MQFNYKKYWIWAVLVRHYVLFATWIFKAAAQIFTVYHADVNIELGGSKFPVVASIKCKSDSH